MGPWPLTAPGEPAFQDLLFCVSVGLSGLDQCWGLGEETGVWTMWPRMNCAGGPPPPKPQAPHDTDEGQSRRVVAGA